jgi:Fic family protein
MIDQAVWQAPEPMLAMPRVDMAVARLLGEADEFKGYWAKLRELEPDRLNRLRKVATVESVGASTRIEGAEVSDAEVEQILKGIKIDSFRARDEAEVRGYGDLLNLVFSDWRTLPLSENYIKQMHGIMLQHWEPDRHHRGDYKAVSNDVVARVPDGGQQVVFRTASPFDTRLWMPRLLEELNQALSAQAWHPLVLVADFVLWFLAIHPFLDGNGRLSRALTTLLLMKTGYDYVPFASLERVIEENKAGYYQALRSSQISTRSDPSRYEAWLVFFLRALRAQQESLKSRVEREKSANGLSGDQKRIVDLIRKIGAASSVRVSNQLKIPARTARYNLGLLVDRGVLEYEGATKGRLYRIQAKAAAEPRPVLPGPVSDSNQEAVEMPALSETGPNFWRQFGAQANSLPYARLVIGSIPETRAQLSDEQLDQAEEWFRRLNPEAKPVRATPEVDWWHVSSPERGTDAWQAWLLPGPVASVMTAMEGMPVDGGIAISLGALVDWWRSIVSELPRVLPSLGFQRVSVGLTLQTSPVGQQPFVIDLDFGSLPKATKGAPPSTVPPWSYQTTTFQSEESPRRLLEPAVASLLRHFSYRHLDETLKALQLDSSDPSASV